MDHSTSRPERFDEVYRTLLVIASVFTGIYLASAPKAFLPGAFQWSLLLAAAIVTWSVAVLWGNHPIAFAIRITGLQILVLQMLTQVWAISVVMNPARFPETGWFLTNSALYVISIVIGIVAGIYLRVKNVWISLATVLMGLVSIVYPALMGVLHS